MTAADVLAAIQAAGLPIDGVTIRDASNVDTWTFYGDKATPDDCLEAVRIVQEILNTPPAVDPIVQLQTDVQTLQTQVEAIAAAVATSAPLPAPTPEPKS